MGSDAGAAYVFSTGAAPPPGGPPGAPVLTGAVIADTATLRWTPGPGSAPSSYTLQASADQAFTQIFLDLALGPATEIAGSVPAGFVAWVRVIARNTAGQATSNVLLIQSAGGCTAAPPSPTGVQVNKTGNAATVSWIAVPGATAYRVEADVNGVVNIFTANVGAVTAMSGTNLAAASYAVRVYAVNACGESGPASVIFAIP
ncbi:MAG: hypothetical protein ACT4QD_13475 [Acidobacteriota bacterium]